MRRGMSTVLRGAECYMDVRVYGFGAGGGNERLAPRWAPEEVASSLAECESCVAHDRPFFARAFLLRTIES